MRKLGQETHSETLYAMYIAIAPRDPRDAQDSAESELQYLEPVTAQELATALKERNVPAQVLDGAQIGAPGWVLARTVGLADGVAPRWAPEENVTRGAFPTISFEQLASGLANQLNAPCHIADRPSIPSTHAHIEGIVVDINSRSSALVGQFRSTDGPLIAHTIGADVWFAHGQQWSTVASEIPEANFGAMIGWGAQKPVVYFDRNGAWRRLSVVHHNYVGHHEWGPAWENVDPRQDVSQHLLQYLMLDEVDPAQFVFDYFDSPELDTSDLAEIFELDSLARNRLELVLNAKDMDDPFTAIARILGLPEVSAEVAEGWRTAEDLPGAVESLHETFTAAVWNSATTTPTENDFSSKVMGMWLQRPPSYYAINALEVAALGSITVLAHKAGHKKTSAIFGLFTAMTFADFFVPAKWRGQRKTK